MKKFFFPNNTEMLVYGDEGDFIGAFEYPIAEVRKFNWISQTQILSFLNQLVKERSPILKYLPVERVESFPMEYFHFQTVNGQLEGNA